MLWVDHRSAANTQDRGGYADHRGRVLPSVQGVAQAPDDDGPLRPVRRTTSSGLEYSGRVMIEIWYSLCGIDTGDAGDNWYEMWGEEHR